MTFRMCFSDKESSQRTKCRGNPGESRDLVHGWGGSRLESGCTKDLLNENQNERRGPNKRHGVVLYIFL